MHLRLPSLALVLLFLTIGARAQTFDTIVFDGVVAVRAGNIAPGTGGGTFVSFSSLSLSPSGAIAFVGSVTGGTVSHGLFLRDGGITTALVLAGDSAPGTGGAFTAFRSVDLNDADEIAFEALATGTFWAAGSGEGVFRYSAGIVSKVVLGEELAPDTGGESYARLGLGEVALGEGGHVAFRADLTGGSITNGFFREPPGGPVSSVALQGQVAPSTGGGTYSVLDRLAVDASGDVAFSASYGGSTLSNGIFLDSSGTDSVVSRQGDFVFSTGAFYGPATCASVSQAVLGSDVELNDTGLVAFRASASLNTGLFSDSAGTDTSLVEAAQGAPTGGMGGAFGCFQSGTHLSLNELGDVAFWAAVSGSSVAEGVFVHSGGTNSAVALEGDTVPGSGDVYLSFLPASVQIDDTGRVAFGALTNMPVGGPDDDADGIPNVLDKCTLDSRNSVAPATCDSDSDGYGNVCDADFNQDFSVNAVDFGMFFVPAFKGQDPAPWPQGLDMNCDNSVAAVDFGMFFVPKFKGTAPGGKTPGPSGLSCAGIVPCPEP
jgi:hypothetical protein